MSGDGFSVAGFRTGVPNCVALSTVVDVITGCKLTDCLSFVPLDVILLGRESKCTVRAWEPVIGQEALRSEVLVRVESLSTISHIFKSALNRIPFLTFEIFSTFSAQFLI
jgi:hypothetical protein